MYFQLNHQLYVHCAYNIGHLSFGRIPSSSSTFMPLHQLIAAVHLSPSVLNTPTRKEAQLREACTSRDSTKRVLSQHVRSGLAPSVWPLGLRFLSYKIGKTPTLYVSVSTDELRRLVLRESSPSSLDSAASLQPPKVWAQVYSSLASSILLICQDGGCTGQQWVWFSTPLPKESRAAWANPCPPTPGPAVTAPFTGSTAGRPFWCAARLWRRQQRHRLQPSPDAPRSPAGLAWRVRWTSSAC